MNQATNTLVIKNGSVLLPDGELKSCDVLIENGSISSIGQGLSAETKIDASGSYVLPGLIDIHTHGIGTILTEDGLLEDYACIEAARGTTTSPA